jgi:predicted nucleic acid-binding protein
MKRTYIDAGVLIAAARGKGSIGQRALEILSDASREFVSSDYVRFETVPKAAYFNRHAEVAFYEVFFARAVTWFSFDGDHLVEAFKEACECGLSAMDAVHTVLASLANCEELVTSERPEQSIHRTKRVRTLSIDPT